MENSEEVWMIHGKDEDGCGIRIRRIEPEWDMLCTCQETGGTFRVQQAGDVDGRSFMDGIRIVRFYPVSGDAHLEAGFHMIPTVGTGAKPSPEQLAVSEDKVRKFEYMWTSRKDEFVLVGIGRKGIQMKPTCS